MTNFVDESKRQKLDRPITGVIQEDRIWEQWYDQDKLKLDLPKKTQKDYLFECIGDEPNRVIINNRGKMQYTVNDFEKTIEKYEKAFTAFGLKKGDVVATVGLTTPEMYMIKYAATTLGIITCNLNVLDIDVTDDGKNRLYRQLENVNPKMIFTLDILEDRIYPVINDNKFSRAVKVSMPLENSTPKYNPERLAIDLKVLKDSLSNKKINNKISLQSFLELGKTINLDQINEVYEENMPCNIAFTSGTTGINKAVLISHDAHNALAFQQKIGDFGFDKYTKQLAVLPPFLAFWDADIVHAVLCLTGENIIEPFLSVEKLPKFFKKYGDIKMGIWPQYYWNSLLGLPKKDLEKISQFLKYAIIGGERCELNLAETFYNETGVMHMAGYGASEVNTTFSITHPYCNKLGSSGIPLPHNNVKIVDDSFKDVTYGKPGKLLITSPCLMNGYYNRDDLTEKALYTDEKGQKWYLTGDYAVIDDDGCLTVLDRYIEPVVINSNGQEEKVNMLDIVEHIKKNRNIKNCKMTYHDGKMVLHFLTDDFVGLNKEEAVESIMNTIRELPDKYWPNIINIVDEFPRTSVGKVDYKKVQQIGEELVSSIDDDSKKLVIAKH